MGRLTFTEYFHLLLTGREPTEEQRYFLDLLLVAIAEHGMMPTNVAARMTLAADPGSLQGAVAAGILGGGPVILGTAEECARLLEQAQGGSTPARRRAVAGAIARRSAPPAASCPGFGHPVHRPLDPRAERILELADERGVSGPHVALARAFRDAVAEAWGRPLTMNVSMPIAAVMLDLGFPAATVKAVPLLARTAGLLAHLAEEQEQPVGFLMAGAAEEAITYEPTLMLDPRSRRGRGPSNSRSTTPPTASSSPTCSSARPSTARSSPRRASARRARPAGSPTSRGCRCPRSASCATTTTPENPFGTHLCATRDEIVRIYSTSGTTGTPWYIPLTAGDLDNWVTGSARSYGASGRRAGPADRLDLQRRAVRGGRGARGVRPHRPLPHPGRHRQHRAARAARSTGSAPRRRCSPRRTRRT